jgi:hypothetical protein
MKTSVTLVSLGLILFAPSSRADTCKLKAISTSTLSGGITVSFFDWKGMDFDTCAALCKDESRLKSMIEPNELLLACRMKHRSNDGTLIRMRYRFRFRPSED